MQDIEYDHLMELMDKDVRYTKLIFRTILCQKEDYLKEVANLENVLKKSTLPEKKREEIVQILQNLHKDIEYLNRLIAVEYPKSESKT